MRELEIKMLRALRNERNFKQSNTQVTINKVDKNLCEKRVYLHGNLIYKIDASGQKYFTLSGWNTPTTRSRLRALGVNVYCKDFTPVLDGREISSYSWYEI